ncbi:uncharacterized protein LOC114928493 isoform X3 [Nylanderia fulva]|uniref:uncharacterized protein LOC114928493 isoform X3 n=1 Tax=Nylanderia fulva TaxID=613905 RepID=UPI0010FBAA86|nr:uncharacterized protein LOC114928493 isoform X3 [Nylanderia fulva]
MAEQIKNIDKYYTDLQYDIDKTDDIVFINTYMDFTGGFLLVPFAKLMDNFTIHTTMRNSINKTNNNYLQMQQMKILGDVLSQQRKDSKFGMLILLFLEKKYYLILLLHYRTIVNLLYQV